MQLCFRTIEYQLRRAEAAVYDDPDLAPGNSTRHRERREQPARPRVAAALADRAPGAASAIGGDVPRRALARAVPAPDAAAPGGRRVRLRPLRRRDRPPLAGRHDGAQGVGLRWTPVGVLPGDLPGRPRARPADLHGPRLGPLALRLHLGAPDPAAGQPGRRGLAAGLRPSPADAPPAAGVRAGRDQRRPAGAAPRARCAGCRSRLDGAGDQPGVHGDVRGHVPGAGRASGARGAGGLGGAQCRGRVPADDGLGDAPGRDAGAADQPEPAALP